MEEATPVLGCAVQNEESSSQQVEEESQIPPPDLTNIDQSSTGHTLPITTVSGSLNIPNVSCHTEFDILDPAPPVPSTHAVSMMPSVTNSWTSVTTTSFSTSNFPSYSPLRDTLYGLTKDDSRGFEKHSPCFIPGVMPTIGLPQAINYSPKPILNQKSPQNMAENSSTHYTNTYDEVQDLSKDSRAVDDQLTQMILTGPQSRSPTMQYHTEAHTATTTAAEYVAGHINRIESTGLNETPEITASTARMQQGEDWPIHGANNNKPTNDIQPIEKERSQNTVEGTLENQNDTTVTSSQYLKLTEEPHAREDCSVSNDVISDILDSEGKQHQFAETSKEKSSNKELALVQIVSDSDKSERQNQPGDQSKTSESNQQEQTEKEASGTVQEIPVQEAIPEAAAEEPEEEIEKDTTEEDTTDEQNVLGKALMDIGTKIFKGSLDQALVNIRGNISFTVNTSGKNKGKSASLRVNKRTPFGDLTNTAALNFGVSLDIHEPPAVVRKDRTKSNSSEGNAIETSPVSIRGDNPYTRKRGRPRGGKFKL